MKQKTWEEIYKDLRNKQYAPVYLLMGEEPFFIDVISDYIEDNVLSDTEKEFDQTVVYGRDVDVPTLVSIAKRYPMTSPWQVVIVKEAQNIRDIEPLESYVKSPSKSTILVVCHKYKTLDKRKALYKAALQGGVVMVSDKLRDYQVPAWIGKYVKSHGYTIQEKSMQLLADHLGVDLGKIVNELKKVFISLPKGKEVTPAIIEQNIGISKDYNIFELQSALGSRDSFKAFQIVKYFSDNPKSVAMPVALSLLHSYFLKILRYHYLNDKSPGKVASELGMNPYFVKETEAASKKYNVRQLIGIMDYLREYDLKSKGVDSVGSDHGELLKELIFKILN